MGDRYMKKRLLLLLLFFLIVGAMLSLRKGYYTEEYDATGQTICLDSEHTISQKLLGNSYRLTKFKISISDMDWREDSQVKVFLVKEEKDINDENILSETGVGSAQIEDGYLICNFDKIYLTYDRDYYIILQYEQSDNDGYINFDMGEGISTCPSYINDEKCVNPLAYELECVSVNTSIFFIWKFIFVFITFTVAFSIFKNIQFICAMPVVTLTSAIFMCASGLFNRLEAGYYIYFALAFLAFVYICVILIKTDNELVKEFYNENIKGQLLVWFVVFAICIVASRGKSVIESDVVVHWGLSVKNIYTYDRFPIHSQSNVVAYRYPPLYSVFQYLCMKLYGHWSESILYFGKYFIMMSIIAGCYSYKKVKGFIGMVVLVVLCICIPEVFFDFDISKSLFVDDVLGIIFGYAMICAYKLVWKNEKTKLNLFVAILSLGLTKESGLVLGTLMFISVLMVKNFYSIKNYRKLTIEPQMTFTSISAVVLAFIPWQIYLKIYSGLVTFGVSAVDKMDDVYLASVDSTSIANMIPNNILSNVNIMMNSSWQLSGISIEKILEYFTGNAESYKYEIIFIHLKKLLFEGYYAIANMSLPFALCLSILVFAIYLLSKKYKENTIVFKQLIFVILIIAFGYIAFLHVVYTFTMTEREALMVASEQRYLGTFLVGVMMLIIYIIINEIEQEDNKGNNIALYSIIISLSLIVFTNAGETFRLSIVDTENIYYQYEPARDDAVKLRKYLGEDDSVYVLTEKYTTEYRIYYNYELLPVKNSYHEFPTDDSTYEPIYDWEPDQLLNNLKNYKYVYLRIKNGNFKDKYGDLFANPEDITDTSLYSFGSDGLLYKVY